MLTLPQLYARFEDDTARTASFRYALKTIRQARKRRVVAAYRAAHPKLSRVLAFFRLLDRFTRTYARTTGVKV